MAASILFLMVPLLFIILVVFIITSIKSSSHKGGEDVIKNVYIYLVLFATLMMTIGGSVGAFMAIADIIAPTPYYQSFEEFKRWGSPEFKEGEKVEIRTDEELRKDYEAMMVSYEMSAKQRAVNTLIKSLGWIIIPLPIFIYFQRRLNRKEE